MKWLYLFFIFMVCSLMTTVPASAQQRSSQLKLIPIKSFTFTQKALMNYRQLKIKPAAWEVNSRGQVRPARGYKMAIRSDKKLVLTLPKGTRIPAQARMDTRPAPNGKGTLVCFCPTDEAGECVWEPRERDDGFDCEGGCECGIEFVPEKIGGIAEYETADGGY